VIRISYAQNYEDIMLMRALGDVDRGFYVDVGAQDPVEDSVTKLFYEQGWRGINIEPVPHWIDRLRQDRPEDVNLQLLITDRPGTAILHEVADTGLSTIDDALAASHAREGREIVRHTLECATLDSILAQHAQKVIHFLKVDVEGAEKLVLDGLSLRQHRPWILVIESCAPNSTLETFGEWEPMVLAAGYRFVYFDGLNRFYLADEHASRVAAFGAPPNVLDNFIRFGEWRVRNDLALLRVASEDQAKQIEILSATVAERDSRIRQWQARSAELSGHIERLQQLADARQGEAASFQSQMAEWRARASELSDHIQRLQQLADGRHAQLIQAETELADARLAAAREITIREAKLVDARAALLDACTARDLVEIKLQQSEALLAQLLGSRSWRMTRPLRVLARLLRHGPGELAGALLERLGTGERHGMRSAAMNLIPGLRRRQKLMEMRAGAYEHAEDAAADSGALSDQGEIALAAMDRARGWRASDQERPRS
jgi:FkbM family methyltransferase